MNWVALISISVAFACGIWLGYCRGFTRGCQASAKEALIKLQSDRMRVLGEYDGSVHLLVNVPLKDWPKS